ncbi:putative nuclease HARBI1 isoform X2 [Harpegnathos saltator]|uniref:putative nuclease HARBI1 isoform X2 n=1 Tax=Harpegnathos saltator TaxID=610380 RepID=UPI000DBEE12D|nr:putative nuclease HARBI1 isoform X2 [Harpegnathos saltator]
MSIISICSIKAIELLDSSESDFTDEEDESILILLNKNHETPQRSIPRFKNYMDVVHSFTNDEFKTHFRLKRSTFAFLLELLQPELCKRDRYGRHPISPEKQLLLANWFISTPNSYRCVSDRFGVGISTAWRSVQKVVNALYKKVATFIHWPTVEEAEHSIETIKRNHDFPGVIGAIDGTHIKIIAPQNNSDSYINRKRFYSIQLQVVCNEQLQFIHCYTGQVGSVHDMRVFRLSNFEKMCTDNNFPHDSHILGDAAYRLTKYIMVPFKDNGYLSERQIRFNTRLSSTRMMVERSIGLLKGRFRSLLDTLPMYRSDLIPKYIIACCILHNICLLQNDTIDIPVIVNEQNRAQTEPFEDTQGEGVDKRNAIMYFLS